MSLNTVSEEEQVGLQCLVLNILISSRVSSRLLRELTCQRV